MKTGLEYAGSSDKRAVDVVVATAMRPMSHGVSSFLRRAIDCYPQDRTQQTVSEVRIGQGEAVFEIKKLFINVEGKQPISPLAGFLGQLGIDELAQYRNILAGEMSAVGYRPLVPEVRQRILNDAPASVAKDWREVVPLTRPGVFSSFSIDLHSGAVGEDYESEFRLRTEIDDVLNGSVSYDMALIGRAITSAGINGLHMVKGRVMGAGSPVESAQGD